MYDCHHKCCLIIEIMCISINLSEMYWFKCPVQVSPATLFLFIILPALIRLFPICYVANWQVQSQRQMKWGDSDLSKVVTALQTFNFFFFPSFPFFLYILYFWFLCFLSHLPFVPTSAPLSLHDDLFFFLSSENYSMHTYSMCLHSMPPTANSPPSPHTQLLKQEESSGPEQNNNCLHDAMESLICLRPERVPVSFPSDPPTVTDGASAQRNAQRGLHYSVTSLC